MGYMGLVAADGEGRVGGGGGVQGKRKRWEKQCQAISLTKNSMVLIM